MSKAGKIFLFSTLTIGLGWTACNSQKKSDSGLLNKDNIFNSDWVQILSTNKGFIRYQEKDFRDTSKYLAVPTIKITNDSVFINWETSVSTHHTLKDFKQISDSLFELHSSHETRNHGTTDFTFRIHRYKKDNNLCVWYWRMNFEPTSGGEFIRRWIMSPATDSTKYKLIRQGSKDAEDLEFAGIESGYY